VSSRNNPQEFWNILRHSRSPSNASSRCPISEEQWHDHFSSLFEAPVTSDDTVDINDLFAAPSDPILDRDITEAEVLHAINKLKVGKSPGPDMILSQFVKSSKDITVPIMTIMFNHIFNTGIFPDDWADSVICPLHKSGSRSDPNNYRGISLINIVCKVFSSVLNARLYTWAEANDKIDESQAGFRKGYSTIDNLFTLNGIIRKYLTKKRDRIYVLYVDFSKAFDNLLHNKLFACLMNKDINGKFLNALRSMYSNMRASVKTNGGLTASFPCLKGTRQGDISSPLLFILFIDDLNTLLRNTCTNGIFVTKDIPEILTLMYADDVANPADTVINLQRQINVIKTFCENSGMALNIGKTEIVVFRNGGPVKCIEQWNYGTSPINIASFYKYMGLIFTPKLSWSRSQRKLACQATKSIVCIRNYQKQYGYFHFHECFKLFDSMVKPILLYGSEIWGFKFSPIIELVQTHYCKLFLGVSRSTNTDMVLGECGRLPLYVDYVSRFIKYWCRILHMSSNRYPKQTYIMLYDLDSVGRHTWASEVRIILCKYGFGLVWLSQDIGDIDSFIHCFRLRVSDCLKQDWRNHIDSSPRCDHYKHFKSLLETEKYVLMDLPFSLRNSYAKFRCSSHKFAIETGRHFGISRAERFCTYCLNHNIAVVEDEHHVLFDCKKYSDIRSFYLPNIQPNHFTVGRFYNLLNSGRNYEIIAVCKLINNIMRR